MTTPVRRALAGVAVAGLAGAASLAGAAPAQSVPDPADAACPEAYPLAGVTAGQPVDGLTVSTGTEPDEFTGEVLGVLQDGIAAGLDMVLVRLTSPEIDRVGGIWQGMSGSPVYAADGRHVGAVSYGLAFGSSPVAGVTPAADMKALLTDEPAPALRPADRVALPERVQRRMVTSGAASTKEADSGMQRLPIPTSVSGMSSSARLAKAAKRLGLSDVHLYRAGAAPTAPVSPADADIAAGGNLAASLAYGDFSAVGVGTTTMVCGDAVVGFGHPFTFTGDTSMTLHGADAVYIQEEPVGAPFKVANPTGPVGVIDQDKMAGIAGMVGPAPDTTLVHSLVRFGTKSRTGDTHVSVPDFAPDATALALLANQDRVFDRVGKGSSRVQFRIDGHTAAGAPFSVLRTNRWADDYDISFLSALEPADDVAALLQNRFTDVTIDNVGVTTDMSTAARMFRVAKVEQKTGGTYRRLYDSSRLSARSGQRLRFRVTLASPRNKFGKLVVLTSVRVPVVRPGSEGYVSLGSAFFGGEEFDEFDEGGGVGTGEPRSFAQLVASLSNAPRNDELTATVDLFTPRGRELTASHSKLVGDVVSDGKSYELRIVG